MRGRIHRAPRSPYGAAAAVVLLLGVVVALAAAMSVGAGAEPILHIALGASFALFAAAAFDFRLPRWITVSASAGMGLLAAIFGLQAASDLTHVEPLTYVAFRLLGQQPERVLGYGFLLWCVALAFHDSRGATRVVGVAALAVVAALESYGLVLIATGSAPPAVLKLLYLPVFVWLFLESLKPHAGASEGVDRPR